MEKPKCNLETDFREMSIDEKNDRNKMLKIIDSMISSANKRLSTFGNSLALQGLRSACK